MKKLIKKGMLFLYPWKDALGLFIGGIPFRLGEIWTLFISANYFVGSRQKIKRKDALILYALLFNFVLTILGVFAFSGSVDRTYAIKYIFRNFIFQKFKAFKNFFRRNLRDTMRLIKNSATKRRVGFIFFFRTFGQGMFGLNYNARHMVRAEKSQAVSKIRLRKICRKRKYRKARTFNRRRNVQRSCIVANVHVTQI